MLTEWQYLERNRLLLYKHHKTKRVVMFLKRNLMECIVLLLIVVISILLGISAHAAELEKVVMCQVVELYDYNVTHLVVEQIEAGAKEARRQDDNVTLSDSQSQSESSKNNTIEITPYWFFDVYCVFAKTAGSNHVPTKVLTGLTYIGERVMYAEYLYDMQKFKMGSDHGCYYDANQKKLRYAYADMPLIKEKNTEIILFGFSLLFACAFVYYIYDKEKSFKPDLITVVNGDRDYIESFNANFEDLNSDYASNNTGEDTMIIELSPTPSRYSDPNACNNNNKAILSGMDFM